MKRTPTGTPVGVDDPYEHAGACDHVTGDGKCRYAFDHPQHDPEFAAERRRDDFRCPAANGDCEWRECTHYRYTEPKKECARCGLEERRNAHADDRPLLEEHHLAYAEERSESAERASGATASEHGADEGVARSATDKASGGRTGRDNRSVSGGSREQSESAGHASGATASEHGADELAHEITLYLCRWCHAKVHKSWARVDDDASPDPEAIAEAEGRRSEELGELGFDTAAERHDGG